MRKTRSETGGRIQMKLCLCPKSPMGSLRHFSTFERRDSGRLNHLGSVQRHVYFPRLPVGGETFLGVSSRKIRFG